MPPPGGLGGAAGGGAAGTAGRGGGAGTGTAGRGGAAAERERRASGTGGGGAGAGGGSGGRGVTRSAGCGKAPTLKNSPDDDESTTTWSRAAVSAGGTSSATRATTTTRIPYRLDPRVPLVHGQREPGVRLQHRIDQVLHDARARSYGLWNLAEQQHDLRRAGRHRRRLGERQRVDSALTDDILREVEGDLCVDTSRVFANGLSYGGSVTAMLACQRADVFRAVAVFAGGISGMSGACMGTMPIAYFGATGTQDSGYGGGQNAVQHFAQVNGCTAQALPMPPTGGHTCVSFQGCSAGHPLRWCPFDDIHTPSPRDRGPMDDLAAPGGSGRSSRNSERAPFINNGRVGPRQ